jgi:hypothetical protein
MSLIKRICVADICLSDEPAATFISEIYEKVPTEFAHTVELEFYNESVEVYITRPETEEEEAHKINAELDNKIWNENNDKKKLADLIKKYGVPEEFKNERTNV